MPVYDLTAAPGADTHPRGGIALVSTEAGYLAVVADSVSEERRGECKTVELGKLPILVAPVGVRSDNSTRPV